MSFEFSYKIVYITISDLTANFFNLQVRINYQCDSRTEAFLINISGGDGSYQCFKILVQI